jgi:hypothetical protein
MHLDGCLQCGDCCRADGNLNCTIYENLTNEQKKEIWKPRRHGVCCMLDGNLCGIEVRFGHEAKPDECKTARCPLGKV